MTQPDVGSTPLGIPATGARRRRSAESFGILEYIALERPEARLLLAGSIVVATLISPNISLPGGLPALRLDQVLLIAAAIPMLAVLGRHPDLRRIGLVDAGFLLFAIATTATLLIVPATVPGVDRSYRDVFEVARIAEYWLVYRLGLTLVPADGANRRISRILAVAAIALGIAAVVQYLNPPGFNDVFTAIWTRDHNLLGVTREGRAVGTAGNANQFGILAVLLLFAALAGRIAVRSGDRAWLWTLAIGSSAVGIVLAQSRGAILGMAVGLVAAAVMLLVRRTFRRAVALAVPPLVAAAIIMIPLIALAPPSSGSIARRLSFSGLAADPSVVVRIGRIATLVGGEPADGWAAGTGQVCGTDSQSPPATPNPGHEPGAAAPTAAPTADVTAIAVAVAAYSCKYETLPTDLAGSLVPEFLPVLPNAQNGLYSSPRGFAIGVAPSVASTSEQPGAGTFPNLLANPSFEGPDGPSPWRGSSGVTLAAADGGAAFGSGTGEATIPAGGAVYQLVVADLPPDTDYTAGIWIRANGGVASPQLYVTAVTATGDSIDPLATSVDLTLADGGWQHLAVAFRTPDSRLTSLQVMLRAQGAPIHVLLDGASLSEGPFALPFSSMADAPASSASIGPRLADSPILGLGPQKEEGAAALDNEYASLLAHYGILGVVTYGLIFLSAFAVGLRAALRIPGWGGQLGVALAGFTLALGVFAVSAGAYRQLQVMLIYWLIVGMVSAVVAARRSDAGRMVGGGV